MLEGGFWLALKSVLGGLCKIYVHGGQEIQCPDGKAKVALNWKVCEKLWKTAQDLIWCELLDVRTLHLMSVSSSDFQPIIQTVLQSSLLYIHCLAAFKVLIKRRKLEASGMVLNCALSAYMDLWQVNHVLDIGTPNAFDTFMHHVFKKCYWCCYNHPYILWLST